MQTKSMLSTEAVRGGRCAYASHTNRTARRARRVVSTILIVSIYLSMAACGSSPQTQGNDGADERGVTSDSLETVAFNSFADWKSFADQVSVIEVKSERAAEDPAQPPGDGRFLLRYVKVRVEKTLWAYGAPVNETELLTSSWEVMGNERRPEFPARGPRLEVGQRYLVALFREPTPSDSSKVSLRGEWGLLTDSSALPLSGDIVQIGKRATPFVESLDGLTVEDLQSRLSAAKPDPLAQKYRALPLPLRQRAMIKARRTLTAKTASTTRPG